MDDYHKKFSHIIWFASGHRCKSSRAFVVVAGAHLDISCRCINLMSRRAPTMGLVLPLPCCSALEPTSRCSPNHASVHTAWSACFLGSRHHVTLKPISLTDPMGHPTRQTWSDPPEKARSNPTRPYDGSGTSQVLFDPDPKILINYTKNSNPAQLDPTMWWVGHGPPILTHWPEMTRFDPTNDQV